MEKSSGNNFFSLGAVWQLVFSSSRSKVINFLFLCLIVAAIPLTVFVAQRQQELRQRASTAGSVTCDSPATGQVLRPGEITFTVTVHGYNQIRSKGRLIGTLVVDTVGNRDYTLPIDNFANLPADISGSETLTVTAIGARMWALRGVRFIPDDVNGTAIDFGECSNSFTISSDPIRACGGTGCPGGADGCYACIADICVPRDSICQSGSCNLRTGRCETPTPIVTNIPTNTPTPYGCGPNGQNCGSGDVCVRDKCYRDTNSQCYGEVENNPDCTNPAKPNCVNGVCVESGIGGIDPTVPASACTVCGADIHQDGWVDAADLSKFISCRGQQPTGNCANADINGDGRIDDIGDLACIRSQYSQQCSANSIPSPTVSDLGWCTACSVDLDSDGDVDVIDIQKIAGCLNQPPTGNCVGRDINGDGAIDQADVGCASSKWGQQCVAEPTPIPRSSNRLKGDYNGDGSVTDTDYTTWLAAYRGAAQDCTQVTTVCADGNNDSAIDILDFNIWYRAKSGIRSVTSYGFTTENINNANNTDNSEKSLDVPAFGDETVSVTQTEEVKKRPWWLFWWPLWPWPFWD